MAFQYGSFRLEAATFASWPADGRPLLWAYVPIEAGLTVLYGLNGAGKSLMLHGLEQSLTGIADPRAEVIEPQLIVQLDPDAVQIGEDGWLEGKPDALVMFEPFADPDHDWGADMIDFETGRVDAGDAYIRLRDSLVASTERWCSFPPDFDVKAFAEQALADLRFSVTGEGSTSPQWAIKPVVFPDGQASEIEQLRTAIDDDGQSFLGEGTPLDFFWPWSGNWPEPEPERPEIYEPHLFSSWSIDRFQVPVLGRRGLDLAEATHRLVQVVHSRIPNPALDAAMRAEDVPSAPLLRSGSETLKRLVFALADLEGGERARWSQVARSFTTDTWIVVDADGNLKPSSGLAKFAAMLAAKANEYFAMILMDAPSLELRLGNPSEWVTGRPMAWGARRSLDGPWVPVDRLSEAERKWAAMAIELALALKPEGVLLIDEPEQALHRAAEAHMARGLRELAEMHGLAIITASHSPELLNQFDAHTYLVRRSDQGLVDGQQVLPLTVERQRDLRDYGLLPSDLLRRQRGFILVEGQHDLTVLNALIGAELAHLRIEILPLRGAGRLKSVIDSRVLYDFTDAHMFVMLDALDSFEVGRVWEEAIRLAKIDSAPGAITYMVDAFKTFKVDEAGMLAGFLTRALEQGLEQRHSMVTLSAPDVLDYLPVESLVPGASSWDALRQELSKASDGREPSGSDFKKWLISAKHADLSEEAIHAAASSVAAVPTEFAQHLDLIRRVLEGR